jgi:hypothetical protein
MLTMIKRGLVLFSMLGQATAAMGQGPSNPPPLVYPFDKIPTDAEIVAALQGSDARLKEVIIIRAEHNLPPHSLQDMTVRAISDEILKLRHDVQVRFKADPLSVNEGNNHSDYVKSLAQVLMHEQNPAGIDGLVAVAGMGAPGSALVEFGEAAVPALIRVASKEPEDEPNQADSALDVLEQILESPTIRPTLSVNAIEEMRQVAAFRLNNTKGNDNWHLLATAAYLAVATGDDQLRLQVMDLIDNAAEFARRGMTIQWQHEMSDQARQALARFPQ